MHLLGHHLPEHKLVRVALLSFHGIGESMAKRLLARLQIPEAATVSSLTEPQVTALSAYLSSPTTSTRPSITPIAAPGTAPSLSADAKGKLPQVTTKAFGAGGRDPLQTLKIETDLRRDTLGNVQHHRNIGTYRGRRHAMGLPVRGQGTRTNARTARKRNFLLRIKDSKGFSTFSAATFNAPVPQPPSQILRMLGMQ